MILKVDDIVRVQRDSGHLGLNLRGPFIGKVTRVLNDTYFRMQREKGDREYPACFYIREAEIIYAKK